MPHPPTTNRVKRPWQRAIEREDGGRTNSLHARRIWQRGMNWGVTWGGSGRQLRSPCFVDLGTASVFGILRKKNSQGLPQAEPNPKGQATVDLQSVWAMTPFSKMDTNLRCQSYPAARRNDTS
uniref:Uncharacterized protein n=1 Tax=Oryza nivara TaxID=4536 RepID=A0A0E0HZP6_ORYNI